MRIKRIKVLTSFRGLPAGYELAFNQGRHLNDKSRGTDGINPICFVGLNGSGKSNILEALAEIFYYLENYHKLHTDDRHKLSELRSPFGFEIDYCLPKFAYLSAEPRWEGLTNYWDSAKEDPDIKIKKLPNQLPELEVVFSNRVLKLNSQEREPALLPPRIIAYSSGMNELLSNPFIKMDFQYFDEMQNSAHRAIDPSIPMNRLFFLNYDSNKPITISNFLFDAEDFEMNQYQGKSTKATDFGGINLRHLKSETAIDDLAYFAITLNIEAHRHTDKTLSSNEPPDKDLPSGLNLTLDSLGRCATFYNEVFRYTKYKNIWKIKFYFWVNKETKKAFRNEFRTAYNLYRQLYFLQLLNCKLINQATKQKVTRAKAGEYENLSAIIPKYEKDKLAFDISDITFLKRGKKRVGYRQLSDGEHQLLQVIGSLLLMDADGSLFLYDEPETHFNPDWRSKFVQLASQSIDKTRNQELILTTHSPYIVSDCQRENVYIFSRDKTGNVKSATPPEVNTFGTSVSILSDKIFNKEESISEKSLAYIVEIQSRVFNTIEDLQKAKEDSRAVGESVEKVLLFRELILRENELKKDAQKL